MSGTPYPKSHQARRGRSMAQRSRAQVEDVRSLVYDRDAHRCLAMMSGFGECAGGLTIQHAAGKGMGGSASFDAAVWLRTLCNAHNTRAETDADFAAHCVAMGWSVPRISNVDPERVVVRYWDGDFLLSRDHLDRIYLTPAEARAFREEGYYREE